MVVETVRLQSGERLPMLLDEQGLPVPGPCEWMLVRRHLSYNSLTRNMNELAVMYGWFQRANIDLFERIRSAKRFSEAEVSSLVECLRRPQQRQSKLVKLAVTPDTANKRIGTAINHIVWCFDVVVTTEVLSDAKRDLINENRIFVVKYLLSARQKKDPPSKKKKRLTVKQAQFLQDILDPDGGSDFGRDRTVKLRNFLAISLMLLLGLRVGELLSLRVSDIEFGSITAIRVIRRGPSLADPRERPPSVKRAGRVLPLDSPRIAMLLDDYIIDHREKCMLHGKASDTPFLFLSDDGSPLTSDALQKLCSELRSRYPKCLPPHLTTKALRHTFTDQIYIDLRKAGHPEDEITHILMDLRGDTATGSQDNYIDYQEAGREILRQYHLKMASSRSAPDVPF
ncbi:hypothetical protein Q069_00059 [Pseudomonas aeruginosa BL15]|uniref:site-specific integrase n=1 Tax=Pseudomonas aeruginosa TaxID=287 RepID=UPI0003B93C3A|nr:site-specific integrase [Pseudomonas aeruginosa]ERV37560.1 hypothetical protein Q069_00059 [Pseudomonas aeruginosa BL15]